MSDATGNADGATPDETFGRFEDDPILGEQFVPRGDVPPGEAAEGDDADTDADDADARDEPDEQTDGAS